MKIDKHLITGMFLGVVFGLHYTSVLTPYATLFLIGAIILLVKVVLEK